MAEVNIRISDEAQLLIESTGINVKDFLSWFAKERKIWIGSGDVVAYLRKNKSYSSLPESAPNDLNNNSKSNEVIRRVNQLSSLIKENDK